MIAENNNLKMEVLGVLSFKNDTHTLPYENLTGRDLGGGGVRLLNIK